MKEEPIVVIDDEIIINRILEVCENGGTNGVTNSDLQRSLYDVSLNQRVKALNSLLSNGRIQLMQSNKELIYKLKKIPTKTTTKDSTTQQLKLDSLQEKIIYSVIEESESKGVTISQIREQTKLQLQLIKKIIQELEKNKSITSFYAHDNKIKSYVLVTYSNNVVTEKNALFKDGNIDQPLMEMLSSQIRTYFIDNAINITNNPTIISSNLLKYYTTKQVFTYLDENLALSDKNIQIKDVNSVLDVLYFDNVLERKIDNNGFDSTDRLKISSNPTPNKDTMYLYRASRFLLQNPNPLPKNSIINNHDISILDVINSPCVCCPISIHCHQTNEISPENCPHMKSWADNTL